ncbi:MAG: thioredoxin family protein [Chitinophagales bacterium]
MNTPIRILILLLFSYLVPDTLYGKGINFITGSWSDIQTLALQSEKPIFVKVHTDWCIPCKDMDSAIFSENEVGTYYNEHFINFIIDVDSPTGTQFKNQYEVNFIPDLLFFAPNGTLLFRNNNLNNKIQLLTLAYSVLHQFSINKELNEGSSNIAEKPPTAMSIEIMQKQFDSGFQAQSFLHDFAYALENHALPYEDVVNKYLYKERKKKSLLSAKNQKFIFHFSENVQVQALDILLQNKLFFAKTYGLQNINSKIKNTLFNSTLQAAYSKNYRLFKRIKLLAKKASFSDETKFLYMLDSKYFEYLKDWKNYIEVTYNFMNKYDDDDPIFLNNQAISILKITENKGTLKEAKKWTEKSIFINPQDYNYQTYAYILYKLGEVKAAKAAAYRASKFNRGNQQIEKKVVMPKTAIPNTKNYVKT